MPKAAALFHFFLTALPMLMMIGLGVLWVDSYRSRGITTDFGNDKPQIGFRWMLPDPSDSEEMGKPHKWFFGIRAQSGELHVILITLQGETPGIQEWKFPGFRYYTASPVRSHPDAGQRFRGLRVSFAILISLCAIYPCLAIVRRPIRRWRRRKRGACLRCGYDLTGNLSGVCPECALPVPGDRDSKSS